jgi:hypothetical protein
MTGKFPSSMELRSDTVPGKEAESDDGVVEWVAVGEGEASNMLHGSDAGVGDRKIR